MARWMSRGKFSFHLPLLSSIVVREGTEAARSEDRVQGDVVMPAPAAPRSIHDGHPTTGAAKSSPIASLLMAGTLSTSLVA